MKLDPCGVFGAWSFVPPKKEPEKTEEEKAAGLMELDPMLKYRLNRFQALGLPYPVALELAALRVDWHRVDRSMKAGCTIEQVSLVFL